MHCNASTARQAIQEGQYDDVVLQEQSTLPVKNPKRNAKDRTRARKQGEDKLRAATAKVRADSGQAERRARFQAKLADVQKKLADLKGHLDNYRDHMTRAKAAAQDLHDRLTGKK